jgi:OOP family OmpA-OmpF porin
MRIIILSAAFMAGVAPLSAVADNNAPAADPAAREIRFGTNRTDYGAAVIADLDRMAKAQAASGAGIALVVGHADAQGQAAYNLDLSERRARAIAQDLIARGVPAAAVSVEARGQVQPAVPTADGVPEPANRRVTVTFAAPGAYPAPNPDVPVRFAAP